METMPTENMQTHRFVDRESHIQTFKVAVKILDKKNLVFWFIMELPVLARHA